MINWELTYSDGSTQDVMASDIATAAALGTKEVVSIQPCGDPILDSAIIKLVDLGLTQDEAQAISGD